MTFLANQVRRLYLLIQRLYSLKMIDFIKNNIKLLHYIQINAIIYMVYFYFVLYGFGFVFLLLFSVCTGVQMGPFSVISYITFLVSFYLFFISALSLILFKIKFSREFLYRKFSKEFIDNHLTDRVLSQISSTLLTMFIIVTVMGIEMFTMHHAFRESVDAITKEYHHYFGEDGTQWSEKVKKCYLDDEMKIRTGPKQGLVSQIFLILFEEVLTTIKKLVDVIFSK